MEEDEEVDIVGGFDDFMSRSEREISNLSSGQILSCDYTVHPRWLSDNNDGTELWPENLPKQSSQDEMEMVQDEVVIEEPAPIDFDWVEETEEISNCGDRDIILEQDIPASLEEEVVTNSGTEAEYESDAYGSSPVKGKQRRPNNTSISSTEDSHLPSPPRFVSNNPRSLLKRHFFGENEQLSISLGRPQVKFKQTLLVNKSLLKINQQRFNIDPFKGKSLLKPNAVEKSPNVIAPAKKPPIPISPKKPSMKFKKSVTLMQRSVPQNRKFQTVLKKLKERKGTTERNRRKYVKKDPKKDLTGPSTETGSGKSGKRGGKKFVDLHGENITINHEADSGTGDSAECVQVKPDPVTEGEIIKVERESESDIEIDIESECDEQSDLQQEVSMPKPKTSSNTDIIDIKYIKTEIKTEQLEESKMYLPENTGNTELDEQLNSMEEPTEAIKISLQAVTELEKYFHYEFFEGRPTKTPERYLKIRAYILNAWLEGKPTYVSKTTVRSGLKHCGDVNCISRIHSLLEQIGAINFGYAGEHFDYVRPLSKLKEYFMQPTRSKQNSKGDGGVYSGSMVLDRKQRIKSIHMKEVKSVDANYTVSHTNGIPTVVFSSVAKEREVNPQKVRQIKPEIELIECMRFTKDKIAPFKVSISLSTLLCLQLHSLSSRYEVMGFLGGFCTKSVGRNKLSITRYKPCNTSEQSGTMCEMCPVSQVEQSTSLISEGFELLGWFHSHPTFEPNPSRTDVRTQAEMQQQFSLEGDRPFVGLIMGCIDMKYNCMYVLPKDLHSISNDTIPYGLDVDVIKDCSNLRNEINDIFSVIDQETDYFAETVRKFLTTANLLLNQYGYSTDILKDLNSYL